MNFPSNPDVDVDPDPYPDPDKEFNYKLEDQENMSAEEKEELLTETLSKVFDPEKASEEAKRMLKNKIKTTGS